LILSECPRDTVKDLGFGPDVKIKKQGHTVIVESGTCMYLIMKPKNIEEVIQATRGMDLATLVSNVPLPSDLYAYLITRVRRSCR
jgi:hypothetical protein